MPTSKRKMEDLAREGKKRNQSKLNFSGHKHQSDHQAPVSNLRNQAKPPTAPSEESTIERMVVDEPSSEQLQPENLSQNESSILPPNQQLPDSTSSPNMPSADLDASPSSKEIILIDKPFHPAPDYQFKSGNRNRPCLSKWFTDKPPNGFPWLHYRPESDTVICYKCHNNYNKGNLISVSNLKLAFISDGFSTWSKALHKFREHHNSECHKLSLAYERQDPEYPSIMDSMSSAAAEKRSEERKYLMKLIECVKFLARQGIPLQGEHDDNDNLTQLLLFRCNEMERKRVIAKSRDLEHKKMSHSDYQNELLELMAREVLLLILSDIRESNFLH